MDARLFDSELKLMNLLWDGGELSAKDLALALGEQVGWSKTTAYTVIKKCIAKGLVGRTDPGFVCRALVTRHDAQARETDGLIDKLYGGSPDMLVAALIGRNAIGPDQVEKLRKLIDSLK